MSPLRSSALAVLLSAALLSGCVSSRQPAPVVLKPAFLPSTFQCQKAPPVPGGQASDIDLAVFIAQLYGAWADCSDQLTGVGNDLQAWSAGVAQKRD